MSITTTLRSVEAPAVLTKELRQELRFKFFGRSFIAMHLLLSLCILGSYYADTKEFFGVISVIFWTIIIMPVALIIPFRGFRIFSKEEKAQELEVLRLTPLSSFQIVSGKWCALVAEIILFATAALPYMVAYCYLLRVDSFNILLSSLLTLLLSMTITAIIISSSAWGTKTMSIPIVTGIISLFVGPSTLGLFFVGMSKLWKMPVTDMLLSLLATITYCAFAICYALALGADALNRSDDNNTLVKRSIGLLSLIIFPIFYWLIDSAYSELWVQLTFIATTVTGICCIMSLCEVVRPLPSINAPFYSPLKRKFSWLWSPGWISALQYSAIILFILFIGALSKILLESSTPVSALSTALLSGRNWSVFFSFLNLVMVPLLIVHVISPKIKAKLLWAFIFGLTILVFAFIVSKIQYTVTGHRVRNCPTVSPTKDIVLSAIPGYLTIDSGPLRFYRWRTYKGTGLCGFHLVPMLEFFILLSFTFPAYLRWRKEMVDAFTDVELYQKVKSRHA